MTGTTTKHKAASTAPRTSTPAGTHVGTQLRMRTADDIRATLADKGPDVVAAAIRLWQMACTDDVGITILSHRTGIGSGILSQYYNGTYNGDYAAIAARIETFFWRLEQQQKYGGLRDYCDTQLSQSLCAVFEKTRITRRIQLLESPAQVGKTRTAKEYCARNNSGRTIYTLIGGGGRSGGAGDFIWDLAAAMDIPYSIKLREKRLRIRERLGQCDLIIIDEAHLIWSWTNRTIAEWLDYIRTDIHADGKRGVVLIATDHDMLGSVNKFRRLSGYNVGQLLGRMRIEPIRIDPAEDIQPADVAMLVGRYYAPGREMLRRLHAAASAPDLGHYGLLDYILTEAWSRARAAGVDLDDQQVDTILREIMAFAKNRKELYS